MPKDLFLVPLFGGDYFFYKGLYFFNKFQNDLELSFEI